MKMNRKVVRSVICVLLALIFIVSLMLCLRSIPNEKVFLYRISMCFGITLISKRILVVYRDDFYMLLILGHDRYHFILRR